jgi:quinoprotein glucose dehydrogenase
MRLASSRAFGTTALVLWTVVLAGACRRALPDSDWRAHGADAGHTQSSPLDQINGSNVQRLQVAWTYRTGDAREGRSQIQCNPLIVHGVLYGTSPQLRVFALDAATGRERWRFNPFTSGMGEDEGSLGVNRGLVFWESGDDQRILVAAGQRLFALDARTGKPVASFGEHGSVSLKEGLGRDAAGLYVLSNTPGALYKDLLILGTRVSEGPGPSAPGHVRAFDVRTGKLRWVFHTIPWPGEYGYDTWPVDAWTRIGGANAWSGISVDEARGLVFLPTGSAAFDFWGGNRHGANLFANCLLVLNAETGKRVWHYQFVHHDLWDRDLPSAPVLVTLTHGGRQIDAVAQTTKSGFVFLFNRDTGEPLFPIEERPVPPSDLQGEQAWPTQPVPLKPPPFARQAFTEAEVTDRTTAARDAVLQRLRLTRTGKPFIPPSVQGTIIFPGFDGGAEWGGAAFDQSTGVLYVNSNEMAWILSMVQIDRRKQTTAVARGRRTYQLNCMVCHGPDRQGDPSKTVPSLVGIGKRLSREAAEKTIAGGKGVMPAFAALSSGERAEIVAFLFGDRPPASAPPDEDAPEPSVPYTMTGYNRFFDPEGYPAVKPPWGTLNAIDLNKGEIMWKVPLGELPELVARGRPRTGTENYGGPVVTAGGLIFIGATKDEKFRAFDKRTGQVLWETTLPAGGYATPATYAVGGKQYVVIAAGGGKMGTKSGDAYVAFALP